MLYITCRIYRTSKKKSARDIKLTMSIKRLQLISGMRKQDWRPVTSRSRYYLLVIVILKWKRWTVERSVNSSASNNYCQTSGQTSRTRGGEYHEVAQKHNQRSMNTANSGVLLRISGGIVSKVFLLEEI